MNRTHPAIPNVGSHQVEIHYKRPLRDDLILVNSADIAVDVLRSFVHPMRMDLKEHMWALFLSASNQLLCISKVAEGTKRCVPTNPSEIFQTALLVNATGLVLVHNHPSGNLVYSHRDIMATQGIKDACKLFEMQLLDHIIISSESHLSMAEEGLI